MTPKRLALGVFVSGSGSNLQAILDACKAPDYPAQVAVVLSNRPGVYALERAQKAQVPIEVVPHRKFRTRLEHEREIIQRLAPYGVRLVVLAGYLRVVTEELLNHFYDRDRNLPGVINIHPADTLAYQGAHGYEFALGLLPEHPKRLTRTKITVHFVDTGVDTGPILKQAEVPILPEDSLDDLRKRGLAVEHKLYPEVIRRIAEENIRLIGQ